MDLHIRTIEPEDHRDLHELFSMPRAIEGTLQMPYPSIAEWKNRCENVADNTYILVCEYDSKVIGSLSLTTHEKYPRRRHSANIGMAVHDDWQGKGIGSELLGAAINLADNWLHLIRLELTVFSDNSAGISLYTKFGFVHEGVLKNYAFVDGQFKDVISMARLKAQE